MKAVKNPVIKACFVVLLLIPLCFGCKKESSEKLILSFIISDSPGSYAVILKDLVIIDENNKSISFKMPYSWDITSLYVIYELSSGATGSLKRREVIDFTDPVPFTVTAEDGSSVTYTIRASLFKSELLTLTFLELDPPIYGILREKTNILADNYIDVTIPFYVDITNLTPVATVSEEAKFTYYIYEKNEYLSANGIPFDFTNKQIFYVTPDNTDLLYPADYYKLYVTEVFISHLSIGSISKISAAPSEKLSLSGYFAPTGNTVHLKRGQDTWEVTPSAQNSDNITIRIPGSLPSGQYTLSVTSHGQTASYATSISVSVPAGQPWITGADQPEYAKGDRLVLTGVNFPSGEIAYINFVPVAGGVTIVRNIAVSGNTATLDHIPDNLISGIEYEISINFSGSGLWTNDYPVIISD